MSAHNRVASSLEVTYRAGCDATDHHLKFGYDARLDGTSVVDALAREIPSLAADLLEIAATLYVIDRSVPRPRRASVVSRYGWGRRISVRIPVRNPDRWTGHVQRIVELLDWLTDDEWELEFEAAINAGLSLTQGYLFGTVPDDAVPALFSGGLDSTSGLAIDLASHGVLAISVSTNTRMSHAQDKVVRSLQAISENKLAHLRYRINLRANAEESSQRSRGFLFLAVGIATALGAGRTRLRFFENGIGAINLPYLRSQLGSEATRAAHPRTLFLMESLVRAVFERPFLVEAPFLCLTKAQLLRAAPCAADVAFSQTVSCDTGFAARVSLIACGMCTSCLLRRQAVLASGRTEVDKYQICRKDPLVDGNQLKAMLWQVSRLAECFNRGGSWSDLVEEFPELIHAAPHIPPEGLARLYLMYLNEWRAIFSSVGIDPQMWVDEGRRR